MSLRKLLHCSLLLLASVAAAPVFGQTLAGLKVAEKKAAVAPAEAATNLAHVTPGPNDGRIAFATAYLLEKLHYSHKEFDGAVSGKFLREQRPLIAETHCGGAATKPKNLSADVSDGRR